MGWRRECFGRVSGGWTWFFAGVEKFVVDADHAMAVKAVQRFGEDQVLRVRSVGETDEAVIFLGADEFLVDGENAMFL